MSAPAPGYLADRRAKRRRGPRKISPFTGREYEDLTGHEFGQWTVEKLLRPSTTKSRHLHWLCRCACGNKRAICGSQLRDITIGGCRACRAKRQIKLAKACLWTRIKHGAAKRGYVFEIDRDQTFEILDRQGNRCALSGVLLTIAKGVMAHARGGTSASLDRIDSRLGYIPGNVWWVHKDVNRMKGSLALTRFLAICRGVYKTNFQFD